MKRYAIIFETESGERHDWLSFRTRFFAMRDMRMLARSPGSGWWILINQETGKEVTRA